MSKQLKDYLHLYLGGECKVWSINYCDRTFKIDNTILSILSMTDVLIKPILRPLPDMTEEETLLYTSLVDMEQEDLACLTVTAIKILSTGFVYLLSEGFDLFGLIEAGLAIDKTKIAVK